MQYTLETERAMLTGFTDSLQQRGIRLGLDRIRALRVHHSTQADPFAPTWQAVHIAGTKGKGSTAEFIRRLLLRAGFRVGAFFSPHVRDPREQIQIGASLVSAEVFANTLFPLQDEADRLGATKFEIVTAVAFLLFDEQQVDYAVIEVGVGGREDATNILTNPAVSVLTPIGLDHQDLLGDTLEEITRHKAGILRKNVPAIVNVPDPNAHAVLQAEAAAIGAPIWDVHWQPEAGEQGNGFSVKTPFGLRSGLQPGMHGPFQRANAATAVTVLDQLSLLKGFPPLSRAAIQEALFAARLPGRYETLQEYPVRVIADGAHNELSAKALAEALQQETYHRLFLVVGMKQNHDINTFLPPLAALKPDGLIATVPGSGRLPQAAVHTASSIVPAAEQAGIPVIDSITDPVQAVQVALARMSPGDLLCVCGSFVLVGDLGQPDTFRERIGSRDQSSA